MKPYNYHWEIKDVLTQFEYAFNDCLIKRYNGKREEKDSIKVRFVYAPKGKVLMDIVDPQKNLQVPCVAINVSGISRDDSRMANMILPHEYRNPTNNTISRYNHPLPVNLSISFSIITRDEDDLWQIISNFAPYPNPYIIISWAIPEEFQLPTIHEIRSEVYWDGNISLTMPLDVNNTSDMFYEATTNFTIKTFLFKPELPQQGLIYQVNTNFYAGLDDRDYSNNSLSAIQSHEQYDATVINTELSSYKITKPS